MLIFTILILLLLTDMFTFRLIMWLSIGRWWLNVGHLWFSLELLLQFFVLLLKKFKILCQFYQECLIIGPFRLCLHLYLFKSEFYLYFSNYLIILDLNILNEYSKRSFLRIYGEFLIKNSIDSLYNLTKYFYYFIIKKLHKDDKKDKKRHISKLK